jgi:hypothetical protein
MSHLGEQLAESGSLDNIVYGELLKYHLAIDLHGTTSHIEGEELG